MGVLMVRNLLEKIHNQNEILLSNIQYEKKDLDYQNLYKAFWICNLRIKNSIDYLEMIKPEEQD